MNALIYILPFMVAITAAATVVALFMGLYAMSAGAAVEAKYSNLMMRWRVGLQGATLALIALWFAVSGYF
ncbi:MAG TPA: hypothetical protein ENI55_06840 [Alphaproteobacteria bacterium]|nr:hypothetical protein [Alphaproteobacteria bacterium]